MLHRGFAVTVVAFVFTLPLYAVLTGDIEGTVYDPSGALVSGAKVTITNLATGAQRELTTNAQGQFAALQLDPGEYQVVISYTSLRSTSEKAVVRSSEKTHLSVNLVVGSANETVEVSSEATPVLDVSTSQVIGQSLDATLAVALPNQGRDPVGFANLSPGVVPVTKDNPFLGTGGFNSNGSRGRANNITVDNAVASDISTTGESGIGTLSLDGVQEVKVITNNFTAEYGRNSGSQVQIITKSGTNSYHGTVYEYHQNAFFNARDHFDTTGKATPLVQNVFGFTAGGPVLKNKMFLFGHYEGTKIRGAGSTATATVLNSAQVATITDPTSLAIFQGAGSPSSPTGQLSSSGANKTDGDSWSLRWDQRLRKGNDTVTVRYAQAPQTQVRPGLTFVGTFLPNYGASVTNTARVAFVSYTSSITTTMVNQARFEYQRSRPNFVAFSTLKPPFVPEVSISGLDVFGESNIIPQGRVQNNYSYSDTFSWARGRNEFKFGTDVFRYLAPSYFDSNLRGTATFASVAAFEAGTPAQWTQNFGSTVRRNRSTDLSWFGQDDLRATQTLTLNLGFRLDSSGGVGELNNLISNIDPNNHCTLGGGGTGPLGCMDVGGQAFARTWNPAPRLGFAWNPQRGKFVVRGGYGLAYDFIFFNPITNLRFSPPFVPSITVTTFTGTNTWANLVAGTAQAQSDAKAAIGQFLSTQKNFGSISAVDQHLKNPRNQQWNLGVEYSLGKDFVLKTSYVGAKNDHLLATLPINLVNPANVPAPATSIADETARRTIFINSFRAQTGNASGTVVNNRIDPRFNAVNQVQSTADSIYHSWQTDVIKRLGRGLSFDANYTYAHSIDDASDALNVLVNDNPNLQDSRNIRSNRGNSQFDIRHRVAGSFFYQFPSHHFSGALEKVLGGWGLSGTTELRTGFPATIYSGPRYGILDQALIGNATGSGINVRANGDASHFRPVPINPLSTSAFGPFGDPCHRGVQTGAAGCAGDNALGFSLTQPLLGNFGSSGRNSLPLDGVQDFDFVAIKDTTITERKALEFRWEVYNIFNHSNFSGFTNILTSRNFGTYTSTATNMRQMQGSLKFIF
ncbi:MAG: TonB-dependent receptor [Acidobacteria bacterium]|nr:TonB-dependent receptor [Acidobacteriota bacterium]